MFFKRFMAVVLTLAMLSASFVFAANEGLLISGNPFVGTVTEQMPTQEELNKNATGFIDIAPDAPYAASVKKLVDFGIINGYEDGTFKPYGEVTRAEMCKMINLTLGYTDFEGAAGFADVQATNWYYTYALAAQKQGYVEGYEDGSFRGSNNITRQEVCAILDRLLKPMNLGIPVNITDTVSNWARPHVEVIVQNYIMPLEANNTFRATENLKRHELATVLSNMAIGPVKQIEADVRFFVNGEQYGETQTLTVGNCAVVPATPELPGTDYVFDGWRVIGTQDVVDVSTIIVTADVDYEAVFVKKLYDVTFYSRGSVYETQVVLHGNFVEAPENPEAKGYDFVGWSLTEDGEVIKLSSTKIKNNVSFYAVFEKIESGGGAGGGAPAEEKFSVKYFVNGDIYQIYKVNKNKSPEIPADPEREGYNFLGWSLEKDGEVISPGSIKVTSNVTLYAVFEKEPEPEPEVFTVTFYADGDKFDTQYVEFGNTPITPVSSPEKEGYVFKYWSKTEGGSEVKISYYTVTSNVNFYAVFEEEEEEAVYHAVTFYVDGAVYEEKKVLEGEKASAPAAPSKPGYNFKGWSKIDGGSVTSVSIPVTEPLSFYAVFEKIEPKKFAVNFFVSGQVYNTQTVVENETVSLPKNPEKEGYIFLGWSEVNDGEVVDVSLIEITYSRNFYAKFEAKPQEKKYYTVTFVSDGKTLSSAQYEEGKTFSIPSDPQKTDHEFLGWSKTSGGNVTEVENVAKENVTYYAVFKEIKKYTVTFYVDGRVYRTLTVVENQSASAPTAPSAEGYNFLGWSKTDGGTKVDVGSVKITDNTNFYALLEEVEPEKVFYTVTFKIDGKNYDSLSVEEGKSAEVPAKPEKDGYTFKGWSKTSGGSVVNVASVKITENTTFYAVFEKNPVYYEVIFMVDGDEYDVYEVLEGEYPEVLPEDPELEGYVFLGWSKTEGGTTVFPERTPVTSNITYYAVFEEEEEEIVFYNVIFWFDGEPTKFEVAAGDTVKAPKIPELEAGVSFLGWSLGEESTDAEDAVEVSDVVIEDHTDFYAILIKNPNSDVFMEKLTRGYNQLKSIKRTTGLTKEAIKILTDCIGYVLEDANNGQLIDSNYVNREYESYVERAKNIVNVDMSSSEKSQFVNLITKTVDKDVQDFLYEYFDIDTRV